MSNGRELLKQFGEKNDLNQREELEYAQTKLADAIDIAKGLLGDHSKNGERFTDAGHSNCISQLQKFVTDIEADAGSDEETPESDS